MVFIFLAMYLLLKPGWCFEACASTACATACRNKFCAIEQNQTNHPKYKNFTRSSTSHSLPSLRFVRKKRQHGFVRRPTTIFEECKQTTSIRLTRTIARLKAELPPMCPLSVFPDTTPSQASATCAGPLSNLSSRALITHTRPSGRGHPHRDRQDAENASDFPDCAYLTWVS